MNMIYGRVEQYIITRKRCGRTPNYLSREAPHGLLSSGANRVLIMHI